MTPIDIPYSFNIIFLEGKIIAPDKAEIYGIKSHPISLSNPLFWEERIYSEPLSMDIPYSETFSTDVPYSELLPTNIPYSECLAVVRIERALCAILYASLKCRRFLIP